jgi:four helix bundle protein
VNSYRDLLAWQKTFDLGMKIYDIAGQMPESERFGLIASMRRLAYQIPSTIADGYGQQNSAEYLRHLRGARGDLYQLDTQMLFAVKRGYIPEDAHQSFAAQWDECIRVLGGLLKSLDR